ncbi:hypothetical protein OEZ49_11280 [Ruegeria sp. WL0004]|uniref:Uncharacterized protein n=1 Tax=Ruegeria marisflavi TaxID=2984152 RepID=A0ABT2WR08_9RHOB|nr:hypothetical protein [Ruegeria sp. WL0004]MCU9838350.1 hypothetical protein [Ruegeria sp. WL0004]
MRATLLAASLCVYPLSVLAATVSGTDGQNALGTVPCATAGLALSDCPAELRRKEDGTATLAVILPGGEVRNIYFESGKPVSSSSPSSISSETVGDTMRIYIEPGEIFELPVAAVAPQ